MMKSPLAFVLLAFCTLLMSGCGKSETRREVRIGCFPNVTHVQALVARNMSRHGEGWFERYLPEDMPVVWLTYHAGPTAMEALFGQTADLTYVGPSPAINAYAVSEGREIRLLAGAVNGGAALLVAPGSGISRPEDFRGRSIATPQLGNTQDISCRAWLRQHGLHTTMEGGGDCRIAPTPNAMQAQLMKQGDLDAAWTVEPWVSTLEKTVGARIYAEEPQVITTVLAARVAWLKQHPDLAKQVLRAHRELTQWILDHPAEAQARVTEELSEMMQSRIDPATVAAAWKRLTLTVAFDRPQLEQFVHDAQQAGLLDHVPPLAPLFYTPEEL